MARLSSRRPKFCHLILLLQYPRSCQNEVIGASVSNGGEIQTVSIATTHIRCKSNDSNTYRIVFRPRAFEILRLSLARLFRNNSAAIVVMIAASFCTIGISGSSFIAFKMRRAESGWRKKSKVESKVRAGRTRRRSVSKEIKGLSAWLPF